ncbi:MAG: HEAT repeat domain-containing protein [Nitrospira sp.]|nr:HEAT repeat domain-containing protein [Nitrospira sp.]MDH5496179.1 HEAT repeat domain-containing protein [Nitrospira sp.]MDH5725480.1 HEAT repeat domain-containing protein [Nitrospira sp.]
MLALSHTDLTLEIWQFAALSIGGVVLLLVVSILIFQAQRRAKAWRRQRVTRVWQPLLEQCRRDPLETLPSLTRREHIVFLYLWNDQYESSPDAASAHLIRMAWQVGTDRLAKDLLGARLLRRRLLAVVTLGRLRDRSVWSQVSALVTHQNSFLAFNAAQALLLIDAQAAIPLISPLIGQRKDWSPLRIASMLSTAGPDLASETIAQAAITGDPVIRPRLIRHLPITHSPRGLSILRQFIREQSPSDDTLAACLYVFGEFRDQMDLPFVRLHISHPAWYVRVQAATALGKLGTQNDEARLIALFEDEQWWVRYRAGEALASLRSMTEHKLELLQETLTTPEAQEILAPILAKFRARRSPTSMAA